jgi:molybdopterin-dependent oxidoreductase alpha subunit
MDRMSRRTREREINEADVEVEEPKKAAAGVEAVAVALKRAVGAMGVTRTGRTLLRLNQVEGFDCQGCAWPDPSPEHRHTAEFCENGVKAVADEATRDHLDRDFFARHSVSDLAEHTDYWLNRQGRITEPYVLREGSDHYEPISWDDAFRTAARHLQAVEPDQAIFYTSGKVSNEAAYLYQLFVRAYGTNNLPDCSNMCHESSGTALSETIGIGKGSVSLEDIHRAELILILGQNPGTNHPRMLSALEEAKRNGAKIIAVNPLRETGLVRFKNPQNARGIVGQGTELADLYLQIRTNGDLALLQALGSLLLEWGSLDREFIDRHTDGFEAYAAALADLDWDKVLASTGLSREEIEAAARMLADSSATITCWAMGITQHHNAVATIKEIVNLSLLQGNIGKPGAGVCPVRGHSNVQGDRTMGIWERAPEHFLDAIRDEFGFEPPREHGYDSVAAIKALRDGDAKVFMGLGGNFVSAAPDTSVTEEAMRRADLTIQVSTKLNRSHVVHGKEALILPPLGRSERDLTGGIKQRVTVEDSMSAVHASHGPLAPASKHLRSEVDIVCSLAEATLSPELGIPWSDFRADYSTIRRSIARVVPDCAAYDEKVDQPGGFVLPHPPRDNREFPTDVGKARFTVSPVEVLHVPQGRLLLQTIRSHDQFNTTIYGLSDRYRGIENGRRVVFLHQDDIAAHGFEEGDLVDIISEWEDGSERQVPTFRVVAYDQPRGCAAAYYPETNPLVPLEHTAEGSNQPAYKSVVVRLERSDGGRTGTVHASDANRVLPDARGDERKHSPQPHQLS